MLVRRVSVLFGGGVSTDIAYDTFTRADGALGSTEATGSDGKPCPTYAWTDVVGTWAVSGNQAVCSIPAGNSYAAIDVGKHDLTVAVNFTVSAGNAGIVAAFADANNMVLAYTDGGANINLAKFVGGVLTVIMTEAFVYAAGAPIKLVISGTSVSLYYNGVQVGSTQVVNELQANTMIGLFSGGAANTFDNFRAAQGFF